MADTEDITVLSLCAGYGGLELGLSRALARTLRVVAVEIEAYALANLVSKTEESKLAIEVLYPDVRTFPAERFSGCFDIVAAGYPCQPFSNAGKRKGAEDTRHLWPHIERIVQAVRPLWCFFENVSGHLSLGFPEVYCSLRNMGYKVEAGLFTAGEVGAPHKRERLFILANSTNNGLRCELENSGSQRTRCFSGEVGRGNRSSVLRQGNGQAGTGGIATTGELAVSDSQQGRSYAKGRNGEAETRSGGEELADADIRPGGSATIPKSGETPQSESCNDSRENIGLANPELQGLYEREEYQARQVARPGQEQYNWEEPRTVEPGMGRTVDGFASRVDELRLLGNGVVPEQAEKAFRELWRMT